MANSERRIGKAVSLYPSDISIVDAHVAPMQLSFSDGVRMIIREWAEMKRMHVVKTDELPHPADAHPVPVVYVQES